MKITLEQYGQTFSVDGLPDDSSASEAREAFDRLLIQAGYISSIRCAEGGEYRLEYREDEDN